MADRLGEIRARVGATTPGEWLDGGGDCVLGPPDECYLFHAQNATEADVAFVANAPADISFLLAEVDRLRAQQTAATHRAITGEGEPGRYGSVAEMVNDMTRQRAEEAEAERDALLAQLPGGMKHCAIVFRECAKGHGWLTATNWVQHGCPTCERDALRLALQDLAEDNPSMAALNRARALLGGQSDGR